MLRVSAAPAQDAAVEGEVEAAREFGVPDEAVLLEGEALAERIRSPRFRKGAFMRDGATVQPARLVRALRRAVLACAPVHEHSRVTTIDDGRVETARGRVRARDVVVATNAAAAGWKPLSRRLTVFGSYVVLTEPVPELLEQIGWTGGEAVFDGRMFLHYFRTTNDGRVLMGSGSGPIGYGGRLDSRFTKDAATGARAERGPTAAPAGSRGRPRHALLGRADRRLLRPPPVLRHGPRDADPLRRRLLRPRRGPELARRPDPGAPRARRRRRAHPPPARDAPRAEAPARAPQTSGRRPRPCFDHGLRGGGGGRASPVAPRPGGRRPAAPAAHVGRNAIIGPGWRSSSARRGCRRPVPI